jgi:G3E family GTPase
MQPNARLPVTILTGFLGSGKTTLLRRLLADPKMSGTAVLINEFGEIGLDHLLVRSVLESAVVLQNGCICCTLRNDLRQGLRELIDGRAAGTFPDFDRVAIETTGLADPAPVAQTLLLDPMLRHQVRLASIISTVDAVHGSVQLSRHPESLRQAATADRLVITKSDLVSGDEVEALKTELSHLNPTARVFDAQSSDCDAGSLLAEGVTGDERTRREVRRWLSSAARVELSEAGEVEADWSGAADCNGHEHYGGHRSSDSRHASDIRAFSVRIEESIDWSAFGVWLTALLHRHGTKVLRVKGLLHVSDADSPVMLHCVQHVIHPPAHLDEWPDQDTASRIVFVVQGLDPGSVKRSLSRFLQAARG